MKDIKQHLKLKLFKKVSAEEAICEKCNPSVIIKTQGGSTKMIRKHIDIHLEELEVFKKLEAGAPTQSMKQFLIKTENSGEFFSMLCDVHDHPVYCKLKAFMQSVSHMKFKTMKKKFTTMLMKKFDLEDSRNHVIATFLDPRFKDYYSANKFLFNQKATKWLLEEVGEHDLAVELDLEQDLSSPR
uniref:BED-type domain-containing protein n=1 Tax=Ditylenchus dipsaci TaxID=166011 RepID=A0A915EKN2_9BILA